MLFHAKTRRAQMKNIYLPLMAFSRKRWIGALLTGTLLFGVPTALAATAPKSPTKKPTTHKQAPPHKPGPAAFSIQPFPELGLGYFSLTVHPGQTLHETVQVVNTGDQTGKGFLYSTDATTGQTSGAVYLKRGHLPRTTAPWVTFPSSTLNLRPHQAINVPFTIHIPSKPGSGQRLAGLVADLPVAVIQQNTHANKTIRIVIETQAVDATLFNLGPPYVCGLQLTGVTPVIYGHRQAIDLGILNSSNVLLKGQGLTTIVDGAGHVLVNKQAFQLDTLVNDTQIQYPQVIKRLKPLGIGSYKASVTTTFNGIGCHKTKTFNVNFKVGGSAYYGLPGTPKHAPKKIQLPWLLIGLGALLALLLALLLFILWRRRAPKADTPPLISVSAQDFSTLLTTDGTWKGGPIKSLTYQWQRGNEIRHDSDQAEGEVRGEEEAYENIEDAITNTYAIDPVLDAGERLRVQVTAHGVRKTEVTQTSAPTDIIASPGPNGHAPAPTEPTPEAEPTEPESTEPEAPASGGIVSSLFGPRPPSDE